MKFNRIIIGATAVIALLASCKKTDNPSSGEASLTLKSEAAVTVDSKSQAVEIEFVTNREWTAKSDATWLQIDPASGAASSDAQKVTVTVTPNDSYSRSATITISIGVTSKKVTLTQEGNGSAPDGSKENPFDIVSVIAKCQEVGETASTDKYYIKGKVSELHSDYESGISGYGNASFYMTDDGEESDTKFLAFQVYYLGNVKFTSADQLKVGDEVIVYGQIVNYKGNTPETNGKGTAYIYSLNGETSGGGDGGESKTEPKGTGTADDPFNAAAANAKCVEIGSTASTEDYYVKGIISKIQEVSTSYGNATFYLSDDGSTTLDQFYVYHVFSFNGEKFASEDQIKVGDEVVVKGKLVNYYGNTPEMTQGGQLVSLNGGQEVSEYIAISVKAKEVNSEAGSLEVAVSSNQSWTVASDSDFATLSAASGENDGTVTVSYTANEGTATRTAKITFTAADGKQEVFTLTQLAPGAAVMTEITWVSADWSGLTLEKNGYTITLDKQNGSTAPSIKDNNVRLYAKGTLTISSETEITSVVIVLADDAVYRYCAVTADSGTVADQASGDTAVYWSGSANSVTFTVGDKAIYGSDGESKAGQLRFKQINVR